MVASIWLFKILASYCKSKLAYAINCPVLRLLCHYWVPDKTGSLVINWWCRNAGLWHFLLLSSLISLYLPVDRAFCLSHVLCTSSCWVPPPESHCISVHLWARPTLAVPITWETARKILWPRGWIAKLGNLDGPTESGHQPLRWTSPCQANLFLTPLTMLTDLH